MAAHSSILAWRITWTEEPGGFLKESGRAPFVAALGEEEEAGREKENAMATAPAF